MAVREFTSPNSWIGLALSILEGAQRGPITVLALAKVANNGSYLPLLTFDASGDSTRRSVARYSSNNLGLDNSGGEFSAGVAWQIADAWAKVAWTKNVGSVAVRGHKQVQATGTWTHNDGGSAGNDSTALTDVEIGRWYGDSSTFIGRMAAIVVWKRVLADAALEALPDTLDGLLAAYPDALWLLTQASTGTAVRDLVGFAHQTSLTGTSVVAGDDPAFDFSRTPPTVPYRVAIRGGTQNLTSSTSTLVDLPDAGSIAVGSVLVMRIACDNSGTNGAATTVGITDPRGNTWTVGAAANQDPGNANEGISCRVAYCVVTNAYTNGDDLTVTYGNSTPADSVVVEEWANLDTGSLVAVAQVTANGVSATPSVSITPTASGQFVYCALAVEGPAEDAYTQDTDTTDGTWMGLTSLSTTSATAASNATTRAAFKLVTGTTAQTWNPGITSRDWAAVAIVFNAASGVTEVPIVDAGEADTAASVSGSKAASVVAGPESDAARAVAAVHEAQPSPGTEQDTVLPVSASKTAAPGAAAEVDSATAVNASRQAAAGQADEVDAARPVTAVAQPGATTAVERAAAPAVMGAKTAATPPAPEGDVARPLTAHRSATAGSATEVDVCPAVGVAHLAAAGAAHERDAARSLLTAGTVSLAAAGVADAARAVAARKQPTVQPAAERDRAPALAASRPVDIAAVAEANQALPIAVTGPRPVAAAGEADRATLLRLPASHLLAVAAGLETALPLNQLTGHPVTAAAERDRATPVTAVKLARLGPAVERDQARPLSGPEAVVVPGTLTPGGVRPTLTPGANRFGLTPGSTRPLLTAGR